MKSYKRKKRLIAVSLSLVLLLVSIIGLASCAISYPEAESLMDSIKAQEQETKEIEDDFIKTHMNSLQTYSKGRLIWRKIP